MYYDGIAEGYDQLYAQEQEEKLDFITGLVEISGSVLDVGCGTGVSSYRFNAVGIDPSVGLVDIARKKYPELEFYVGKGEELPFEDKQFDWVISLTALQNFADPERGISEIDRVGTKWVITFLKKSAKCDYLLSLLESFGARSYEQEKDWVFIKE